jgi:hypothetical protein
MDLDKDTDPMTDMLTVKVKVIDTDFTPVSTPVEIVAYKNTAAEEIVTKSFLKKTTEYVYSNDGNINDKEKVKIKTSLFSHIFTKTTPKAYVEKDDNGRFLVWDLELSPNEYQSIIYIRNYRALFYVLILLILGVVGYYIFRSPILVKKETEVLKIEDQGVSHFKVLMHLKNRSNKAVDEVKLIDRIPQIASLDTSFGVGTLNPDKVIRHEHKGTILKWNISALDPYEERIISYNVASKLKIIGGVNLPAAVVKFKGKGKSVKRIFSNKVTSS